MFKRLSTNPGLKRVFSLLRTVACAVGTLAPLMVNATPPPTFDFAATGTSPSAPPPPQQQQQQQQDQQQEQQISDEISNYYPNKMSDEEKKKYQDEVNAAIAKHRQNNGPVDLYLNVSQYLLVDENGTVTANCPTEAEYKTAMQKRFLDALGLGNYQHNDMQAIYCSTYPDQCTPPNGQPPLHSYNVADYLPYSTFKSQCEDAADHPDKHSRVTIQMRRADWDHLQKDILPKLLQKATNESVYVEIPNVDCKNPGMYAMALQKYHEGLGLGGAGDQYAGLIVKQYGSQLQDLVNKGQLDNAQLNLPGIANAQQFVSECQKSINIKTGALRLDLPIAKTTHKWLMDQLWGKHGKQPSLAEMHPAATVFVSNVDCNDPASFDRALQVFHEQIGLGGGNTGDEWAHVYEQSSFCQDADCKARLENLPDGTNKGNFAQRCAQNAKDHQGSFVASYFVWPEKVKEINENLKTLEKQKAIVTIDMSDLDCATDLSKAQDRLFEAVGLGTKTANDIWGDGVDGDRKFYLTDWYLSEGDKTQPNHSFETVLKGPLQGLRHYYDQCKYYKKTNNGRIPFTFDTAAWDKIQGDVKATYQFAQLSRNIQREIDEHFVADVPIDVRGKDCSKDAGWIQGIFLENIGVQTGHGNNVAQELLTGPAGNEVKADMFQDLLLQISKNPDDPAHALLASRKATPDNVIQAYCNYAQTKGQGWLHWPIRYDRRRLLADFGHGVKKTLEDDQAFSYDERADLRCQAAMKGATTIKGGVSVSLDKDCAVPPSLTSNGGKYTLPDGWEKLPADEVVRKMFGLTHDEMNFWAMKDPTFARFVRRFSDAIGAPADRAKNAANYSHFIGKDGEKTVAVIKSPPGLLGSQLDSTVELAREQSANGAQEDRWNRLSGGRSADDVMPGGSSEELYNDLAQTVQANEISSQFGRGYVGTMSDFKEGVSGSFGWLTQWGDAVCNWCQRVSSNSIEHSEEYKKYINQSKRDGEDSMKSAAGIAHAIGTGAGFTTLALPSIVVGAATGGTSGALEAAGIGFARSSLVSGLGILNQAIIQGHVAEGQTMSGLLEKWRQENPGKGTMPSGDELKSIRDQAFLSGSVTSSLAIGLGLGRFAFGGVARPGLMNYVNPTLAGSRLTLSEAAVMRLMGNRALMAGASASSQVMEKVLSLTAKHLVGTNITGLEFVAYHLASKLTTKQMNDGSMGELMQAYLSGAMFHWVNMPLSKVTELSQAQLAKILDKGYDQFRANQTRPVREGDDISITLPNGNRLLGVRVTQAKTVGGQIYVTEVAQVDEDGKVIENTRLKIDNGRLKQSDMVAVGTRPGDRSIAQQRTGNTPPPIVQVANNTKDPWVLLPGSNGNTWVPTSALKPRANNAAKPGTSTTTAAKPTDSLGANTGAANQTANAGASPANPATNTGANPAPLDGSATGVASGHEPASTAQQPPGTTDSQKGQTSPGGATTAPADAPAFIAIQSKTLDGAASEAPAQGPQRSIFSAFKGFKSKFNPQKPLDPKEEEAIIWAVTHLDPELAKILEDRINKGLFTAENLQAIRDSCLAQAHAELWVPPLFALGQDIGINLDPARAKCDLTENAQEASPAS